MVLELGQNKPAKFGLYMYVCRVMVKGKHGRGWLPWYCFSTGVQANL